MGNCQAAEAAAVVIVHPAAGGCNKVDRIYCSSLTARDVMNSNPGHYVAQLLLINNSSVINVLKEFAANKCMKLGRLLMEQELIQVTNKNKHTPPVPDMNSIKNGSRRRGHGGRKQQQQQHQSDSGGRLRQWKPALNSISELGN
ncbi:uncharacterized protein LOC143604365 [Bidens hawaiensis]|uniref:uncharacterized protein LOC143604365 n=1 Tax=Bidens hawaiensis TaxID=980011 RepID=UPI00404A0B51